MTILRTLATPFRRAQPAGAACARATTLTLPAPVEPPRRPTRSAKPLPAADAPRHPAPARGHAMPAETGPLALLGRARRVLVVADAENLAYSARDRHAWFDFAALARLFAARFPRVELHAVASVEPNRLEEARALARDTGWVGHPRPIISTPRGRCANADVTCAFVVANALANWRADTLVIGTGDGALGLDIARKVREAFPACRRVATLSLAGSTSGLLDARRAPEIDANLEAGLDVVRPLGQGGGA